MIKILSELTGRIKEIRKDLLVTGIKKMEIFKLYQDLYRICLEETTKELLNDSLFINLECQENVILKLYSTDKKEIVSASKLLKSPLMKHALDSVEICLNLIERAMMKEQCFQQSKLEKIEEIEAIKVTTGQMSFGIPVINTQVEVKEELTDDLRASDLKQEIIEASEEEFNRLVNKVVEAIEGCFDYTHLIDDIECEETQQMIVDEAYIIVNEERETEEVEVVKNEVIDIKDFEAITEEVPEVEEINTVDHKEIKTKAQLSELCEGLKQFLEMNPMFTMNDLLKLTYGLPLDVELMTFNQAKKEGLKVKKGSKSYTFWSAPIKAKNKKESEKVEGSEEEKKSFKMWGICKLFTMDQIESPEDKPKKEIKKISEKKIVVETIPEIKEDKKEESETPATDFFKDFVKVAVDNSPSKINKRKEKIKEIEVVDTGKNLREICFDLKMDLTSEEKVNKYYEARIEIVKLSPGAKLENGLKEIKRLEKLREFETIIEPVEVEIIPTNVLLEESEGDNAEHLRATEVHLRATLKEVDVKDYEARYQIKAIMTECFTEKSEDEKVKLRRKIEMAYNRANEGKVLKEKAVKIGEEKEIEVTKSTRILSVGKDSYNAYDRPCGTGDLNKIEGMQEIKARVFVGKNGKVEIIYDEDVKITELRSEVEELNKINIDTCKKGSEATEIEKDRSRVNYYHGRIELLIAENKTENLKSYENDLEKYTKSLEAWEKLEEVCPEINKLNKKDMCKYLNTQRKENKWWLYEAKDYKKDQLIKKISIELFETGVTKGLEKGMNEVVKTSKGTSKRYQKTNEARV